MKINYQGRRFIGVNNSPNGQVSGDTIFHYEQKVNMLKGLYYGGKIQYGQLLGFVSEDSSLYFSYHHIDTDGNLKSGYCRSIPELMQNGKIRLHENWEWTLGGEGKGESVVEEID